jgi:peptidyl-prolyl cis-trans isomerase C
LLAALLFASTSTLAAAGDASAVVVRAGELTVSVADVNRRLQALAPAQITGLGGAPNEAPRRFVDSVIVPELVTSLEARQRGLDKSPKFHDREREALRQAMEVALKAQALAEKPVKADEVKAYFEANKDRFEQPLRIRVWRILVDDEATAKHLLEQAKAAGSPAKWSELARDSSIDKATNLRQGDLGFVHPDGSTDAPRLRVDPALFRAAQAVKDGEFVASPVREGGKFAVIWRRGSLPEKARTLDQEQDSIRSLLERRRVEEARTALLASLRSQFVHDEHLDLLEQIPDSMFGNKLVRPRPNLMPHRPAAGVKAPEPSDRGLR